MYERHMKRKLAVAIDHFNKDHKKGLQVREGPTAWKDRLPIRGMNLYCLFLGLFLIAREELSS